MHTLQRNAQREGIPPVLCAPQIRTDLKARVLRWNIVGGICQLNGFRYGAELGVSLGRFTAELCAYIPDMRMICVDRWAEQPENAGREAEGRETFLNKDGWCHEAKYRQFKEYCSTYLKDRVTIYREDSVSAARHVEDGSLDFVFIDADHSYEGCLADIKAWTPKVRLGGMISGHDYNPEWPGVVKAVAETGKARLMADHVWVRFKL